VNSNTATSRLVNEELLVGSVHLRKVGHVSQEDLYPVRLARCIRKYIQASVEVWGRKLTLTLTILETSEPAAVRIALMLSQQT
jgi:hypothetical protein